MRICIVVLLATLLSGCGGSPTTAIMPTSAPTGASAEPFRNPLNYGAPDPWMTYYEGSYYLAATTWGGPTIGLTMRSAETIAGLKRAKPERIWQDWDPQRCCNYWAPEFFLLNGPNGLRWYGYFSGGPVECCDNQRIHVIESSGTDLLGPYTYKGQLRDSTDDRSIDASMMQLNGKLYALFASRIGDEQRIYIAPMGNPWTLSADRVLLSAPTHAWEKVGRGINQGPVALQHDGKTYIIYSASYCGSSGYALGMLSLTGSDPLRTESWTKAPSPVFQGTDTVFSPGHNNFFKSPDGTEDWIVYHANDSPSGRCDMNRTPRIQRFTWNPDGTPSFGSPLSLDTSIPVPSGEGVPAAK